MTRAVLSPPRRAPLRAPGIGLGALLNEDAPGWLVLAAPVLDRLLGIHVLDALYRRHGLRGLPPFEFAARTLDVLGITLAPDGGLATLPAQGPVLVVCNHPFGGVEALALMATLSGTRRDIRFLANGGLGVFGELRDLFIATNPLRVTQRNLGSIRQCAAHLQAGGVLVVFPAGKVSSRAPGVRRIADAPWNRLAGHLARTTGATLLPVFFHGANRPLFHRAGALWERAKLLLLPREFLALRGREIRFTLGRPIPAEAWRGMDIQTLTQYARAMTYLLELPPQAMSVNHGQQASQAPLAPLHDGAAIAAELAALPDHQRLLDYKHFSVFHARAAQIPLLMENIARERERVFRMYDEGSGQPRDGDDFDAAYAQLFVWDRQTGTLVGAYRLGHADELRQAGGTYLARMFEFEAAFYTDQPPMLELGRSFVVPEHQKNYYALYLLWQGIGRYLAAHPRYRRLYGTVSLSRQYDSRAIALMCDALIEPSPHVRPRHRLDEARHPEWQAFLSSHGGRLDLPTLSACVRGIDGKDVPILLKHYHKLGARFHCVGVDPNFNATPGLLLSVDMDAMPAKLVETFLGDQAAAYLGYGAREQ